VTDKNKAETNQALLGCLTWTAVWAAIWAATTYHG
jgi:hypothetical protein